MFSENYYSVGDIICKIMRKFEKLEHVKGQSVTIWPENIRPFIVQIFDWLQQAVLMTAFCNWSNIRTTSGLISSDQNVTHQLLMCYNFSNFLIILHIIFPMQYQFSEKHRS
jgi:hypothetical protein